METIRRLVFVGDPALDTRQMKLRGAGGYGESRDESLVRTLPGRSPVWFTVRWLTPRESILVDERGTVLRRVRAALATALTQIDMPSGETMRPTLRVPDVNGAAESRLLWDDEGLDLLTSKFGKAAMLDIGTAVLEADDRPGEAFASGDALRFTLLPSSLAAWERNERLLAAQPSPESATQNSAG